MGQRQRGSFCAGFEGKAEDHMLSSLARHARHQWQPPLAPAWAWSLGDLLYVPDRASGAGKALPTPASGSADYPAPTDSLPNPRTQTGVGGGLQRSEVLTAAFTAGRPWPGQQVDGGRAPAHPWT